MNSNLSAIQQIPMFRRYSEIELAPLISKSSIKSIRKNTIVILESDEAQSVYFVLQGTVRVFRENGRGREVTLNELGPGDLFGELAWFSKNSRSASVITKQQSKLLVIQAKDFESFYLRHPEISHVIALKYADQISILSKHLETIALEDIQQRVMWALRSYALVDEDNALVSSATHKELANLIGSSRESVSRAIQELKLSGHIELKQKTICLTESVF
ncbi:MAG: Crp/Fnr family transcriptional regulator [Gammaproteobacteria bacterium]